MAASAQPAVNPSGRGALLPVLHAAGGHTAVCTAAVQPACDAVGPCRKQLPAQPVLEVGPERWPPCPEGGEPTGLSTSEAHIMS
jgi:hypothetical protein